MLLLHWLSHLSAFSTAEVHAEHVMPCTDSCRHKQQCVCQRSYSEHRPAIFQPLGKLCMTHSLADVAYQGT
jgi:hypothetical protein